MAVSVISIVKHINVVDDVRHGKIACFVDTCFDAFLSRLLYNDSATALSEQFPRWLH